MSHKDAGRLCLGAYNGTRYMDFPFSTTCPQSKANELCEGLQWTEQRDIIATDYSLDIPTEKPANHFQHLVKMSHRMARI